MQRFVMLFALALTALAWTPWLDARAASTLDAALARTLGTFAVARATNAAISMIQDADVTITPVGVGLTVSPGELLDPVDDLVEQLSSLLLLAATSLGIQRIALELGSSLPIQVLLTLAAIVFLVARVLRPQGWLQGVSQRMLFALLVLRWMVPAYALLSESIDHFVLAPRYEAALAALTLGRDQALAVGVAATPSESSQDRPWSERLGAWLGAGESGRSLQSRIQELSDTLASLGSRIVELFVVFSIQAIVLPIAFVWLSTRVLRVILLAPMAARPIP
jgi:hypothetical protein